MANSCTVEDLGLDLHCKACKKRVGRNTLQVYWLIGTHAMELEDKALLYALKKNLVERVQTHLQNSCSIRQMPAKEAEDKAETNTSCRYYLGKDELDTNAAGKYIKEHTQELKAAYKRKFTDAVESASSRKDSFTGARSSGATPAEKEPKQGRAGESASTCVKSPGAVPAVSERADRMERSRREDDASRARSRTKNARVEQPATNRAPSRAEQEEPELNSEILGQGMRLLHGVMVPPPPQVVMPPQRQPAEQHSPPLQLGTMATQQELMTSQGRSNTWLEHMMQVAQQGAHRGGGIGGNVSVTNINIAAPQTSLAAVEASGGDHPRSQYHASEMIRTSLGHISDPNIIVSILQMVSARMEEIRGAPR
jgi:hypothetical protein